MKGPTGGGFFGGAAAPLPDPTTIPGLVGWWREDGVNSPVDGAAITSITDLSTLGAAYGGGTGFTYRATRWNTDLAKSKAAINCVAGNSMFAASAALIAAFNGVNHPFTVIDVYQDIATLPSTALWSAENTFPNVITRNVDGTYHDRLLYESTGGISVSLQRTQGPKVSHFEKTPTAYNLWINGVLDPSCPIAATDARNFAVTKLSWGEQDGFANAAMLHRQRIVYNRVLTPAERQTIQNYCAQQDGLGWVQSMGFGVGTTGNDVVVLALLGQSNNIGQGTVPYTIASKDVWVCDWDFIVRTASEPFSTTPQVISVPPDIIRTSIGNYDAWGTMVDTLKADPQFANKTLLVVPLAVGGASSATCVAGITGGAPYSNVTMGGNTILRLQYAMTAKNATLVTVNWQGESNVDTLAHATTGLSTDWTSAYTTLDTVFAGKFLKSKHHFAIIPPPTVPVTFDATNWAAMRATWAALPSTVTNLVTVNSFDGPFTDSTNLHVNNVGGPTVGLQGNGMRVAQAILAAS